ncbi:hypothetical protein LV779_33455 [Streptomyces thinghirensis]|nr:hypothetical protein [Streptomyces thinghirensis]
MFVAGDAGRGQSLIVWGDRGGPLGCPRRRQLPDRSQRTAGLDPPPTDRALAV